jgi:hypothetical protein
MNRVENSNCSVLLLGYGEGIGILFGIEGGLSQPSKKRMGFEG